MLLGVITLQCIMKLKLVVESPTNGLTYRPSEAVKGRVEVRNMKKSSAETITNVHITFQGVARVVLKPGFDAAAQVAGTYRKEKFEVGMFHVFSSSSIF